MSYLQPSLTGLAGIIFYVSHFLNTWLLTVFILCRLIYAYCIVYRFKKNIKYLICRTKASFIGSISQPQRVVV